MNLDIVGWIGIAFTFTIFLGYLLGDNPLYRWAVAVLVGVGTGYAFAITTHFLVQWIMDGVTGEQHPLFIIPPLIFGFFLLLKGFPRLSPVGNISMGLLLGVGGAVAISGALLGTLLPQMVNTGQALVLDQGLSLLLEGVLMMVGVLLALFAFSPHAHLLTHEPSKFQKGVRWAGQSIVAIALGVAFAGALTSALTILVERWWTFIIDLLFPTLGA